MMQPLKIYSNTISCSKPFTEEIPFTFHFATFQSLRAENPELLAQSFTQGPIPTLKGCTTFEVEILSYWMLSKYSTSRPFRSESKVYGRPETEKTKSQCMYQSFLSFSRSKNPTRFIEVLVPGIFPGRYQQVEDLVRKYWSLLLPLRVKKQCTADQEIRDYICIVFYFYWIDLDLSTVVDPGSDTKTSDERRVAAQELELLARQGLGYFLLMVVQNVRWSCESQSAVHVKEEGCASTIQSRSEKSEGI
ncbi:uncharacterized protein RAG0_17042 [Rhynchosporium agropyri]|uniref:Uncharacterized protein n=1 Tax=Rhynchosporium agropyri TaxID=914238 RepID=A0A1E1LSV8_9HELO|nr:uncharacterized protein RAG0_17042 [Rhynchosporium agropyri]